ncbi:uncharacterized protein LOC133649516 [Entelurus aequoreus]|uniref:uncharacterized protein LOC133649516 n=1 Tax=Entelurus aequoreus TaxID=161455 RepID=UPI002B1D15E1|nr:uncharacterized protein LOC133649516 [Entelurus aequoreus]
MLGMFDSKFPNKACAERLTRKGDVDKRGLRLTESKDKGRKILEEKEEPLRCGQKHIQEMSWKEDRRGKRNKERMRWKTMIHHLLAASICHALIGREMEFGGRARDEGQRGGDVSQEGADGTRTRKIDMGAVRKWNMEALLPSSNGKSSGWDENERSYRPNLWKRMSFHVKKKEAAEANQTAIIKPFSQPPPSCQAGEEGGAWRAADSGDISVIGVGELRVIGGPAEGATVMEQINCVVNSFNVVSPPRGRPARSAVTLHAEVAAFCEGRATGKLYEQLAGTCARRLREADALTPPSPFRDAELSSDSSSSHSGADYGQFLPRHYSQSASSL